MRAGGWVGLARRTATACLSTRIWLGGGWSEFPESQYKYFRNPPFGKEPESRILVVRRAVAALAGWALDAAARLLLVTPNKPGLPPAVVLAQGRVVRGS